jgi:hypothetical protein
LSKYLEYLVELLDRFYLTPDLLTENEAQILLRLIRKAHKEHKDDLNYVLNPPENKSKGVSWVKKCVKLTEKHTNELWSKYYKLIREVDQQTIKEVAI